MTFNKISFPDEYKRMFTLSDLEACRKLKESIKKVDGKIDLSWEAAMAAVIASDSNVGDGQILAVRPNLQRITECMSTTVKDLGLWMYGLK